MPEDSFSQRLISGREKAKSGGGMTARVNRGSEVRGPCPSRPNALIQPASLHSSIQQTRIKRLKAGQGLFQVPVIQWFWPRGAYNLGRKTDNIPWWQGHRQVWPLLALPEVTGSQQEWGMGNNNIRWPRFPPGEGAEGDTWV